MPVMTVRMDEGGKVFVEEGKKAKKVIHLGADAPPIIVQVLEKGMTSGRPSIMMGLQLPEGELVLAETSVRLFLAAADVLRARYGECADGQA